MGDLLGLLDISEDSIANAAISRSETGVILVSHEQFCNLFLAIGMRIQCDHDVAEITELNDQDVGITPFATKTVTTLPSPISYFRKPSRSSTTIDCRIKHFALLRRRTARACSRPNVPCKRLRSAQWNPTSKPRWLASDAQTNTDAPCGSWPPSILPIVRSTRGSTSVSTRYAYSHQHPHDSPCRCPSSSESGYTISDLHSTQRCTSWQCTTLARIRPPRPAAASFLS